MATDDKLSFDEAQAALTKLEEDIQAAEREHATHEAERGSAERELAQVVARCGELGVEPDQLEKTVAAQSEKVTAAVGAAQTALDGVDGAEAEEDEPDDTDVDGILEGGDEE